jgi:predicted RNA methylase
MPTTPHIHSATDQQKPLAQRDPRQKGEDFLAICARFTGNALIAAECEALTGSRPSPDGIALCREVGRIQHGAYVLRGLRLLARADTLAALVKTVAGMDIAADDFRIEVLQFVSPRVSERQTVIALANALTGFPNLDDPSHRFMVLVREEGFYFGEIIVESDQGYRQHSKKPYHMSSSLSSQVSRALVNLVAPPATSILDPCCGSGSILLEAQALGLDAYGLDLNPRMVGMARKNLAYFGYAAQIQRLDARQCQLKVDAVVTDLPYGRFQIREESNLRGILEQCARLAPIAVFVAGEDLSRWLQDSGYMEVEIFPVVKFNELQRFVHRARSTVFV